MVLEAVVVVPTEALTRGKVTLAPSASADAPKTVVSLAFGPRVTVLVQPAPMSTVTAAIATSVFICFFQLTTDYFESGSKIINKPFPKSSVIIYVAPQIIINGLVIEVLTDNTVKIYDVTGDLTKDEALKIVKYLHAEAFITGEEVVLEIVTENDI